MERCDPLIATEGGLIWLAQGLSIIPEEFEAFGGSAESIAQTVCSPSTVIFEVTPVRGVIALLNVRPGHKAEFRVVLFAQRLRLAEESARGVIEWAFSALDLKRLTWALSERQEPAIRMAERLGFSLEGVLRDDSLSRDGTLFDTLLFGMHIGEGVMVEENSQ